VNKLLPGGKGLFLGVWTQGTKRNSNETFFIWSPKRNGKVAAKRDFLLLREPFRRVSLEKSRGK